MYADQPPKRVGANIEYGVGGVPQPVEQWQNGANPHATLSAVSVFDSDCASVHIREKNEVAFRPPDGHPKLLHLWPVKLLQAGRSDGNYTGATAMREAASFSR